jgi:RNA polymerase sigma factor (TIGR02999 family)
MSETTAAERRQVLEVDELLARVQQGDRLAFQRVIPLIYDELRAIAHRHRGRWTGDETLGTTALVHEAYLKLVDAPATRYTSRPHLLAVASRAMRQILVDYARSKHRAKRGGGAEQTRFEEMDALLAEVGPLSSTGTDAVLAVNESLDRLKLVSDRHAAIVECRFFGGLSVAETARALHIAPATVKRGWAVAQAWLRRDLAQPGAT